MARRGLETIGGHAQHATYAPCAVDDLVRKGYDYWALGHVHAHEILHRAQLSPIAMTFKLTDEQVARLYEATRQSLIDWTNRLREEAGAKFPEGVTAFRDGMAVHGRYGKPCPRCGAAVQPSGPRTKSFLCSDSRHVSKAKR